MPTTQAKWDKRGLSTKFFSSPPPKKFLQVCSSFTTLFNLFFDDKVVEYLAKMTKLYSHQEKGKYSFNVNQSEMRLFIAILLLSGCNVLPRRKLYLENSSDVKNKSISIVMSRNRFEEILSLLHCCDSNQLDPNDEMSKVRQLFNPI